MPQIQRALKAPALRPAVGAEDVDLIKFAQEHLDLAPAPKAERRYSFFDAMKDQEALRDGTGA